MLILKTYMNNEGFAYPGQPTWAKGARKSVRMIQRYIARARSEGWLAVMNAGRGGRGWAFNGYRCCVPGRILLREDDERIGDFIQAQVGDIEQDDIAVSVPSEDHDTIVSPPQSRTPLPKGREPSRNTETAEGDDMERSKVTTSGTQGDDISSTRYRHLDGVLTPSSRTPSFRTHAQEEARVGTRALIGGIPIESVEERSRRVEANRRKAMDDIARLQAAGKV